MEPARDARKVTLIRRAAWLVGFDEGAQRHVYRRDCDVAIQGDRFVKPDALADQEPDEVIDGRDLLVMPGFVDLHAHPSFETMLKGLTDEVGSCKLYMSSLHEYLFLFESDAEGMCASSEVALSELMRSGV